MAFCNLKFDTLTTSDSINTGTEKSVDTSYIHNGVCKGWSYYTSASSFTLHDSFNVSSITDAGAGDGRSNLTNVMAGSQTSMTSGCSGDHVHSDGGESASQIQIVTRNTSNANADSTRTSAGKWGDLA